VADLSNIESAWLTAVDRFERWRARFDAQFYAPASKTMLGMMTDQLSQLPPEVQQISRQMNPQAWKDVDRMQADTNKQRVKEVKYGI